MDEIGTTWNVCVKGLLLEIVHDVTMMLDWLGGKLV